MQAHVIKHCLEHRAPDILEIYVNAAWKTPIYAIIKQKFERTINFNAVKK
jgi:hypothetical protein